MPDGSDSVKNDGSLSCSVLAEFLTFVDALRLVTVALISWSVSVSVKIYCVASYATRFQIEVTDFIAFDDVLVSRRDAKWLRRRYNWMKSRANVCPSCSELRLK